MSYVHPFSKRCDESEIDLFSVPPTQQSLERGRWIDYAPLSSVENTDSPINFLVTGTDEYIDLSKTILTVTGKIVKDNESVLDGANQTNVAPVNNFLHSLFKQVDVYLNGKQVTPAMGTYAYRAYIETLLNYDVSAKESQFSSALYYKDTATQMDEAGSLPSSQTINYKNVSGQNASLKNYIPGTGNQGFAKRSKFIQNSKQFVLSGPIFADIFMTDRLLLNMMDLRVVLNCSAPGFCLMDTTGEGTNAKPYLVKPKVQLSHVELKIRKVKLDQAVSDGIERMLKQTPALYPIRRVECKILTVPANLPTTRQDNIFSGLIPKTFVVGFVTADAAGGVYHKNPYNFAHFGVTSLSLTANGEEIPFKQLTLKYPKKANGEIDTTAGEDDDLDFDEAYNTLFSGTGKIYSNAGLDIDRDDYPGGYALYAFDLSPDMCKSSQYFNTVQRGSLSLALTFKSQSEPLALVCYGDFENVIRIDAERNAIYDIS